MDLSAELQLILNNIKTILNNSSLFVYKKVVAVDGALEVVADDIEPTASQIKLADVTPVSVGYAPVIGDYVILVIDAFLFDVLKRLESLGYSVLDADTWVIAFSIQKVENSIKNSCNTTYIPDGLYQIMVDKVCGEFLFTKKQSGQLVGFDMSTAVKQVQAGDTNITFAIGQGSMTPEQRLDSLIAYLTTRGDGDFVCYRKIKW